MTTLAWSEDSGKVLVGGKGKAEHPHVVEITAPKADEVNTDRTFEHVCRFREIPLEFKPAEEEEEKDPVAAALAEMGITVPSAEASAAPAADGSAELTRASTATGGLSRADTASAAAQPAAAEEELESTVLVLSYLPGTAAGKIVLGIEGKTHTGRYYTAGVTEMDTEGHFQTEILEARSSAGCHATVLRRGPLGGNRLPRALFLGG